MSTITVKLYASFRHNRFKSAERGYATTPTVRQVIDELDLPVRDVGFILIDDRHAHIDDPLPDGAVLSLLPRIGGG